MNILQGYETALSCAKKRIDDFSKSGEFIKFAKALRERISKEGMVGEEADGALLAGAAAWVLQEMNVAIVDQLKRMAASHEKP